MNSIAASDGRTPILDVLPSGLHERTPLFVGSKRNVAELVSFTNR
ncbi:MAG: hypothetical protein KA712_15575 [Myxococcales bacterium]|nr:hypothetical protein [Myxococcales bacterium]